MTWSARLAEAALRLLLPRGVVGASILGDLREAWVGDEARFGSLGATLRYLRSAASIALRFPGRPSGAPTPPGRGHRTRGGVGSALRYDLRQASRILLRRPGLTLAAVLSLGLGIGANTALFTLVNTILFRPLPYPDAHELVEAFRVDEPITGLSPSPEQVSGLWAVPYEVHLDWLAMGTAFEDGGGYAGTRLQLVQGDQTSSLVGMRMTSGAFRALGVEPELGRYFLPEEDAPETSPVAVLGHGTWQARFGGDPGILGSQIRLSETSYTVTGIMPPGFAFPDDGVQLWVSFSEANKSSPVRNGGYMKVVGRLRDGVTLEDARREMDQVSVRIGEIHPEEAEHRVGLFPLKDMIVGGSGAGLLVLLGAVALVLLIACTNVAGLLLVRASERRREIGVRRALGAGRDRLVFQQMVESLLLAFLGGAAGWFLASVGMRPVLSLMPQELPRLHEVSVDQGLLLTAAGLALLTGLLTGFLPAVRAAGTPITSILQEGGRGFAGSRARSRTQMALVVSQVALAFLLLAGAALVVRSMLGLLSVDTGMDTRNIAVATVSYPSGASQEEAQIYFRELEERIRALPGVVEAGGAEQMPFSGGWSAPPVTFAGPEGEWDGILNCPTVTPSYLSAMNIPVLLGRGLSETDTRDAEPVVVISRALADRITPDGSPLGYRIRINNPDSIWRTVVGVVGDVRYRLDQSARPMAYLPMAQAQAFVDNWVIKTAADLSGLSGPFRRVREELDPEGTHDYQVLDDLIHRSTAVVSARFSVLLLGSLALLAALLAVLGVYGVLAYLVQLRSREIGIQLALGADRGQVLRGVLRQALALGGIGLGAGFLLSLASGRLIQSQLFGVEPWDPGSLAASGTLLLAAVTLAGYVPARRAAGVDPVETLKGE